MKQKKFNKTRARLSILNEVLSFASIRSKDWWSRRLETNVIVGDLVSLNCAPVTPFYLSWVIDIRKRPGWTESEYLLESVDDGSLCWWSNVGMEYYDRKRVSERVTWKWDDSQFAFYDRWIRVGKRNDAYIVLPVPPIFHDDNSVTLDVRIRHGWSDFKNPQKFDNYKKLLSRDMSDYYLKSVEKYNSTNKEIKSICET